MNILRKKQDGYMTVFASLCFAIIMSLVTVCIDGARLQGSKALAYMINDMSLDTLMSYYHKTLFEEYQLFFLDAGFGENKVDETKMKEIFVNNAIEISDKQDKSLLSYSELTDAKLSEFEITNMVKAVDANGKIFEKEITEYMKYGFTEQFFEDFKNEADIFSGSQKSLETNDETKSIEKKLKVQNEKIFDLIEKVDGIVTNKGTIQVKGGRLDVKSSFAKKIIYYDKSAQETGINNSDIYNALQNEYIELNKTLAELKDAYDNVENTEDTSALSKVDKEIAKTISDLEKALEGVKRETDAALQLLVDIDSAKSDVQKQKEEVKTDIANKNLDEESKKLLTSTVDEMCDGETIYDEEELKKSLEHNKTVYTQLQSMIDTISQDTTSTNIATKIDAIIEADNYAKTLKIKQMSFDYSKFDMNASSGTDVLDAIEDFLDAGLLSFVVDDVSTLSQSTLTVTPNTVMKGTTDVELVNPLYGKFLTTQYALDYFANYTSDDASNNMKYELEYILCGEDTDKKNLTETVVRIAAVREIANYTYLLTDAAKRQEALDLATALVGFTTLYPLVLVTQFLILGLWAYAEGIMDAKVLLSGGKVPITKDSSTWQLSLNSLMNKDIGLNENKGSDTSKGYDYEQYMQFMLYTQKQENILTRMMDMIEEKMHKKGYGQFSMKNCIYLVETRSSYDIKNGYSNISLEARKSY